MRFKIKLLSVFIVLLTICNSCLEGLLEQNDCNDCYFSKPDFSEAEIKLTINYKYQEVPVIIYKGNIEDDDIIFNDTISTSPFYYSIPVEEKISIKAEYKWGNKTVFAVDGTKIKVTSYDGCDDACYKVKNDKLDVRIKSDFQ